MSFVINQMRITLGISFTKYRYGYEKFLRYQSFSLFGFGV